MKSLLGFLIGSLPVVFSLSGHAETVYSHDFQTAVGSEWSNQTRDTTPTGRQFLGRFLNQDHIDLSLGTGSPVYSRGLPAHNQATVAFDLFIIHSWDGTPNGDEWLLRVKDGPVLLDTSFANPKYGTANNPQSYPGTYPNDLYPAHTGATEVNTLGYWTVTPKNFGDSVYHIAYTFPHTANSLVLQFIANGITGTPLTGLGDETWGLDNVQVQVTPEPGSILLILIAGSFVVRRYR